MSDEESFVILGSCSAANSLASVENAASLQSDFQSLENVKINIESMKKEKSICIDSTLETDGAKQKSPLNSLENSALKDASIFIPLPSLEKSVAYVSDQIMQKSNESQKSVQSQTNTVTPNASILMSLPSLEKSVEGIADETMQKSNESNKSVKSQINTTQMIGSAESSKTSGSLGNSLAASFILGEVQADVLKSSVYSQFPSLCSMESNAEEVVKLQNILSEYVMLKGTLANVSTTMKKLYVKTQQWREDVQKAEQEYKEEIKQCRDEIQQFKNEITVLRTENTNLKTEMELKVQNLEKHQKNVTQFTLCLADKTKQIDNMNTQMAVLRNENLDLKHELNEKMEQIKISNELQRKEVVQLTQAVSEKAALIQNMRAQMECLEKEQLTTFEYISKHENDTKEKPDYIARSEHLLAIKELERKMSAIVAENYELKDMKKIYLDEINCLKVNLVSAEELSRQSRADIELLKAKDTEKSILFSQYENERDKMREEIGVLRHQVEVYSKDFQMERTARESLAGEKDQLLLDLRQLQITNQRLIEEQQRRVESVAATTNATVASAATETNNTNNQVSSRYVAVSPSGAAFEANLHQRPIRRLPAQDDKNSFHCPVCSQGFKSLTVLQSHVNQCLDRL